MDFINLNLNSCALDPLVIGLSINKPKENLYFKVNNLFSELVTDLQKQKARENLGITQDCLNQDLNTILNDINNLRINNGVKINIGAFVDKEDIYPGTSFRAYSNKILANGETLVCNDKYEITKCRIFEGEYCIFEEDVNAVKWQLERDDYYYQFEFKKIDNSTFVDNELEQIVKLFIRNAYVWNEDSNLNNFISQGYYNISGSREANAQDNMPIYNGGKVEAKLQVLESENCVTQILTLLNVGGGDGNIYTRVRQNGVWEQWGKLQTNIEVGRIEGNNAFDNFIDNGMYSGVYVYGSTAETFVLIVINAYLYGGGVSQLKYSTLLNGTTEIKLRTKIGNSWGDWISFNKTISDIAEETIRAKAAEKANADAINEEKERAEAMEQQLQEWMDIDKQESIEADNNIKENAMQYNTLGVNVYANKAEIYGRSINSTPRTVDFPAATIEKAGVMSANDKKDLQQLFEEAIKFDSFELEVLGDGVGINYSTFDGNGSSIEIPFATTNSAGVMSAADKRNLLSVIGESLAEFDFSTGAINNYANRSFNYNFVKGQRYRLEVLTDESIATTYFSIRSSNNTGVALQNNIMTGSGRRSVEFISEADADMLYMSIDSNGVAITYDVEITNMSTASVASLALDNITRDARIDDLTRTLLQLPTTDDFVEGKRLLGSGNISSRPDCSATEKYFYIPAKTKISVKGRIFTDYTFVCVYDTNYNVIHIVKGQGVSTDVEYTLEYDYPTYIRIATTTSKISDFSISYDGDTVWQDVSNVNNRVTSIENATESLGKPNTLNYEDFEIGGITIDRTGWSYKDNTDSRVRMKAGITYHLFVGDVVKLPDGVRAYLGFRVGNTYDFKSWVTNEFTIVTEGDYKILLSGVSESTLSSKFDLLSGVSIVGGERRYENTLPIDADALATMRVINHRGFNGEAPENTLPAFELSKLKGFRYVETDIRFTADGVAVCLHDDTVDRTSNGSGSVATMTLEELRALDFGSWFSADYAGVQIPTFEEFIVLCKQLGLKPYIELKNGTAEQIKQLFDLVRLYGMEKHSTFISYDLSILQMVIANSDKVRVGLLADTYSEEYLNKLISLKGDKRDVFANLNCNNITDRTVFTTIRNNGCDVESYTGSWGSWYLPMVDGVTTDGKMYWDYSGSCSVWRSKTNGWKE